MTIGRGSLMPCEVTGVHKICLSAILRIMATEFGIAVMAGKPKAGPKLSVDAGVAGLEVEVCVLSCLTVSVRLETT